MAHTLASTASTPTSQAYKEIPEEWVDTNLSVGEALRQFESIIQELDVRECILGDPYIQAQIRQAILESGVVSREAIARGQEVALKKLPFFVLRNVGYQHLPYSSEHDVRGALLVGLTSFNGAVHTGNYHDPNSCFAYRHITPWDTIPEGCPKSLLNSTRDGFPHSDSSFLEEPEDTFMMAAARQASSGGESLIWVVEEIKDWIGSQNQGAEALEILSTIDFPFVGSILEAEHLNWKPILWGDNCIRFKMEAIEDALKVTGDKLSAEQQFALDMLCSAFVQPELTYMFRLETGDQVWIFNHATVHSRLPFSDSKREMIKATVDKAAPIII